MQTANILKLALFTGMRRGELFNLKWEDIDFDNGFITIRNPKGGLNQIIPFNDNTKDIFDSHPKSESDYVFPSRTSRNGKKRSNMKNPLKRIKKLAELPKDFRLFHGLRHTYASMLASSGKIDLYTLQKLLTHKSPQMTQRYAHLHDETLKKAADLAGEIIDEVGRRNDYSG